MSLTKAQRRELQIATGSRAGANSIADKIDAAASIDGSEFSLTSQAQGTISYYDGTAWVVLPVGTNGQFLKTQGASANPVWAAGTTSSLANGKIFMGDGGGVAQPVTPSGDVTTSNTGVNTIAAAAVTSAKLDPSTIQYASVSLSKTDILALNSVPKQLIAAAGAHNVIEVLSVAVCYKRSTATYTAGGNVSVQYTGGVALTGVASAANSFGGGANKIAYLAPVVPTNNQLLENTAVEITSTVEFTDPGTAAGTALVKIAYRIHASGF